MASVELSRCVEKVVGYPPLVEMDDLQRREFHEALLRTISAQAVVLTLGGVLFIRTVIWVATFPVTVTI